MVIKKKTENLTTLPKGTGFSPLFNVFKENQKAECFPHVPIQFNLVRILSYNIKELGYLKS